ncbi:MAG: hypothetical protein LBP86_08750 [Azoarcus sp.]|jgi:hypothetical protein|nr:hypothetical protein [Azoarcus sp.]
MTQDELFIEFEKGFSARKFTAGLLIAFIDFYMELGVPGQGFNSHIDVIARFPRQLLTNSGKRANTLIVSTGDGKTLSLRPFYNSAERFFRAENKRFDYPSCAPHATQAWGDYVAWLDALPALDKNALSVLRQRVVDYVLAALPSQDFDPASVKVEPPLFRMLLEEFDPAPGKGEPTGAAFQGIVFGNETGRRGTLGLVAALGFHDATRQQIEAMGLKAIDKEDLLRIVELWDPLKQRTAVASLVYYARHIEKNSSLANRIDSFLTAYNPAP